MRMMTRCWSSIILFCRSKVTFSLNKSENGEESWPRRRPLDFMTGWGRPASWTPNPAHICDNLGGVWAGQGQDITNHALTKVCPWYCQDAAVWGATYIKLFCLYDLLWGILKKKLAEGQHFSHSRVISFHCIIVGDCTLREKPSAHGLASVQLLLLLQVIIQPLLFVRILPSELLTQGDLWWFTFALEDILPQHPIAGMAVPSPAPVELVAAPLQWT